jgi:predicted RNA-binding protein with PIN domain
MFALGLLGKRHGPDGFRKVRTRFLNDLAAALGAVAAHQTTVVFDAHDPPGHLARESSHKGISVVYAVDDEDADARIERLIAAHSAPKTLTVVSSDHRIQKAATRRKAKVLSADEFLTRMDSRKESRRPSTTEPAEATRPEVPTAQEAAFWLEEFRELAESEEAREISRGDPSFPTDAELAQIEREVEEEFRRR